MTSRFLWTVNFFARNGFYVLIDNHLNMDPTARNNVTLWLEGAERAFLTCTMHHFELASLPHDAVMGAPCATSSG